MTATHKKPDPIAKGMTDSGCIVLAFPGCYLPPVVNLRRRGRLPKAVLKLSDERKRRLERQEWAKAQAKHIAELESSFHAAGVFIQMLRDKLAAMGYAMDGTPMVKKNGGQE